MNTEQWLNQGKSRGDDRSSKYRGRQGHGAEASPGCGDWGGVCPSPPASWAVPPPRIFFDFWSKNGNFLTLGSILCVLH